MRIIDEEIKPLLRAKMLLSEAYWHMRLVDDDGKLLPLFDPKQSAMQKGLQDARDLLQRPLSREMKRVGATSEEYLKWERDAFNEVMREIGREEEVNIVSPPNL